MSEKTTRERIVEAADLLFYQQGFERTSFADIAASVGLSRGNFYYHFKTKDEILDAVIALRVAGTKEMIASWEACGASPPERIRSFVRLMIDNREEIRRYGCPVGTLCTELVKLNHPAQADATMLFTLFRVWLGRQFVLLGRDKREADALSMHLLARSQGIATLSSAFQDGRFIDQEIALLDRWLAPHLTRRPKGRARSPSFAPKPRQG